MLTLKPIPKDYNVAYCICHDIVRFIAICTIYCDIVRFIAILYDLLRYCTILLRLFGFLAPSDFKNYLAFKSFDFEHTLVKVILVTRRAHQI